MSEQPKSIWCSGCRISFAVRKIAGWHNGAEHTRCTHRRNGKACDRPFWHGYGNQKKDKKYPLARVGIEPHRLAEWQS